MANFVLSTHMTNGDVLPFLRLASALHQRGHRATLVTHGVFAPLAEKAGIGFRALDEPEEYTDIMKDLEMWKDPDLFDTYEKKYYSIEKLRKEYNILTELCQSEDSVLICKEQDSYVAMIVSEKMNVPIVTGVLAPNYLATLRLWGESEVEVTSLAKVNDFRETIGMQPVKNWVSWMMSVKKHIGFWHEVFDQAKLIQDSIVQVDTVGFPMSDAAEYEELPQDLIEFIEAGEPPVLITGGTGKMINSKLYESSIEACKLLKQRTILVTRHDEFVHCELPEYIKRYKVLPLAGVYPLVSAVIHHGGIGTVTGAMVAGVPQLVLGADVDRPDNGMRIKRLGIGDYLPPIQWEPRIVANTIQGMMNKTVKKRCVEIAEIMIQHDTMASACEVAEQAIGRRELAIQEADINADHAHHFESIPLKNNNVSEQKRAALKQLLLKRQQEQRQH